MTPLHLFFSLFLFHFFFFLSHRYTCSLGGFPVTTAGKEPTCHCRRCKRHRFDPWIRKIPWRRTWQLSPVFLPGESHGQRSRAGYSPWYCKEWDTAERLNTTHTHTRTHARTHAHTRLSGDQNTPGWDQEQTCWVPWNIQALRPGTRSWSSAVAKTWLDC